MSYQSSHQPDAQREVTPARPRADQKRELEDRKNGSPEYFAIQATAVGLDDAKIAAPDRVDEKRLVDASAQGDRTQD